MHAKLPAETFLQVRLRLVSRLLLHDAVLGMDVGAELVETRRGKNWDLEIKRLRNFENHLLNGRRRAPRAGHCLGAPAAVRLADVVLNGREKRVEKICSKVFQSLSSSKKGSTYHKIRISVPVVVVVVITSSFGLESLRLDVLSTSPHLLFLFIKSVSSSLSIKITIEHTKSYCCCCFPGNNKRGLLIRRRRQIKVADWLAVQ